MAIVLACLVDIMGILAVRKDDIPSGRDSNARRFMSDADE
jgi:hypothetical protein